MNTAAPADPLLKLLGVAFGVAISVGVVIGSGILRGPGPIAGLLPDAGAILLLWTLGGLHALLGANVTAELGAAIPQTGGLVLYARRAYGPTGGLIVGWSEWGSTVAGIAAASIAFAEFLALLVPAAAAWRTPVAVGLQLLLLAANVVGLREGSLLQNVTSAVKAVLLAGFVVLVLLAPAHAAGGPVLSADLHGPVAVALAWVGAYQLIVGAYSGWDAPVYFSGENVDAARSIPRAVFLGALTSAVLYVAVNGALLHGMSLGELAHAKLPFSVILQRLVGPLGAGLFAVGALFTVLSGANANVLQASRIVYGLGRSGLLPAQVSAVNRGGSPWVGFGVSAAAAILLTLTGGFTQVFAIIGTLSILSQALTTGAYFVLRRREPELERPFRAWGHPWLPGLVLAINVGLVGLFAASDRKGAAFGLAAIVVCAAAGRWLSRRGQPS